MVQLSDSLQTSESMHDLYGHALLESGILEASDAVTASSVTNKGTISSSEAFFLNLLNCQEMKVRSSSEVVLKESKPVLDVSMRYE